LDQLDIFAFQFFFTARAFKRTSDVSTILFFVEVKDFRNFNRLRIFSFIVLKTLVFIKFSTSLVQLNVGIAVTDLTDGVVSKVRDGVVYGALNTDGVVVAFINAKCAGDSEWKCLSDCYVCWSFQSSFAVGLHQLTKSNRAVFEILILEISAPLG
jgi:hypothetical protein